MDSYFFLHTRSLIVDDYNTYKAGLMALNSLTVEMLDDEKRIKHEALYLNPFYSHLFSDFAETGVIIQFIEQCPSIANDIDDDATFETYYPKQNIGFLGISFHGTLGIAGHRQVSDSSSLRNSRNLFLTRLIKEGLDKDLSVILKRRFPKFNFSSDAQTDMLWWKHNNIEVLDSVLNLLDDIPVHPFTGGLGKTEVLSNTRLQVASKRITKCDRLTYTFGDMTTIHRCKEHY